MIPLRDRKKNRTGPCVRPAAQFSREMCALPQLAFSNLNQSTAEESGARKVASGGRTDLLALDEGEQVAVDDVRMRAAHAVWQARVHLERAVPEQLGRQKGGIGDWHDLIIVAVYREHRHVDLLQVHYRPVLMLRDVLGECLPVEVAARHRGAQGDREVRWWGRRFRKSLDVVAVALGFCKPEPTMKPSVVKSQPGYSGPSFGRSPDAARAAPEFAHICPLIILCFLVYPLEFSRNSTIVQGIGGGQRGTQRGLRGNTVNDPIARCRLDCLHLILRVSFRLRLPTPRPLVAEEEGGDLLVRRGTLDYSRRPIRAACGNGGIGHVILTAMRGLNPSQAVRKVVTIAKELVVSRNARRGAGDHGQNGVLEPMQRRRRGAASQAASSRSSHGAPVTDPAI